MPKLSKFILILAGIPVKNGKRKETNLDYCKGCGICSQVCPIKIIKMK
ncbi:4Fe-4S binding protein [Candidatus Kuenenbacteria bacterium]|nr:4Fe-4S binding protein [Candidatus Kuenenbacteria bacterium]